MSPHRRFIAASVALLLASPLAAQGVSPDTSAVIAAANVQTVAVRSIAHVRSLLPPSPAPAWATVDLGARETTTATVSIMAPQRSEAVPIMMVGGAALFAGAFIGGRPGTAIMVAGSLFGLLGLWTYLK
jgi:hypothetical protein